MPGDKPQKKPRSRREAIAEESKLAAAYGLAPRAPISLAENFRVERSSPSLRTPPEAEPDAIAGVSRAALAASRWLPREAGVAGLAHAAAAALEQLDPETPSAQVLATLLQRVQLVAARGDTDAADAMYERLSQQLLGREFPNLPRQLYGGRPPRG